MLTPCCSRIDLSKSLTRSLIASILATIAILCGIIPEFSWHPAQLTFSSSAYTQDISDDQIVRYARAVIQIEPHRLQALEKIRRIMEKPPEISCDRPNTLRNLPSEAQKIAVGYCNTSKKIVENSGLSPSQFNEITRRLRSDAALKQRVRNAIIRIQREGK